MVGRKRIGEQAMTAAERQRRKRHLEEARAQRAQQAREALAEASDTLTGLWNRLNGREKFREIHAVIGRAGDLCRRAKFLLEPVYHLPVSTDEPRRLICGSSDYVHVANSLTFTLIHEERRCPECARRRHEFYP
ncbi:hypothetical protein [Ciceribacter thiooxidans]|uniref:Uncharacterized protein n=1 Tax=Ciceribacter thiooxidans TaxID=1969821 RepID=A0ABV7I131_9HYPH|nr:hypothetical protein [Ciceribacter thiooxidans]